MIRVSSNMTLVLKIFLPTAWFVFFGMLTAAILFSSGEENPLFANTTFKIISLSMFICFLVFLYLTVMRLMRVEYSDHVFSASNYFKTYQYLYQDIEKIKEIDLILFSLVKIKMKAPTRLGRKIYFLKSKALYNDFVANHSDIFEKLM